MCKSICVIIISVLLSYGSKAQNIPYPYPVKYITVNIEAQNYQMAFMDILPARFNGRCVLLMHGKNFTGLYWHKTIYSLAAAGYRVVVPDQVGRGLSSKPNVKYTFEMLADNTSKLLDTLQIDSICVVGHSMGGMLATRFALRHPDRVTRLVLEDPLGLEDYRKFVPVTTMETQYKKELKATYASYKKYQASYYPVWKPQYEVYVKAQADALKQKDFPAVAWVYALTYQMIYDQPVLYEFNDLHLPVLLVYGALDRTFIGKDLLDKTHQKLHGNFPALARDIKKSIPNCRIVEFPNVGHIPHIQETSLFNRYLLAFLKQ